MDKKPEQLKTLAINALNYYTKGTHEIYCTIGEIFNQLREGKNYKKIGYKNLNEMFRDFGAKRSECYKMMNYAESFSDAPAEVRNIPVETLLKAVLPLKSGLLTMDRLLEIAALPDTEEMTDEINGFYKKKQVDCLHEEQELMMRCKTCHKWIKQESEG